MVPAVSEVWRRQALHWNSWRDRTLLWRRSPQDGHSKPSGQRQRNSASRQASSVPYCRSNSASLSPFWNCTELRATAIPLQTHWCSRFVLGRSQLRKPRNQVILFLLSREMLAWAVPVQCVDWPVRKECSRRCKYVRSIVAGTSTGREMHATVWNFRDQYSVCWFTECVP